MSDEEIIQQEISQFLNELMAKIEMTPENVRLLREHLLDAVSFVIGRV